MDVTPLLRRLAAQDAAGPLGRAATAALCVAVALAARFALEPLLRGELAYATFYPALVIAALWGGRTAGAAAMALSVAAVWAFVPPYLQIDGEWRLGVTKVLTFGLSGGFLVLVSAAFRDALRELDRRLAQESSVAAALKESEARFRGVFQSGALGLAVASTEHDRPLEVNDRFLEIVGIDRATFDSGAWSWRAATPAEHLQKDDEAARVLIETGRAQTFEKELLRPDGTRVPVVLSAGLMPDFPGLAVVTVQDVSEMRHVRAALAESEARFRSVADTAPAPIWVTGADGRRLFVNDAYCEFVGRPYEEAVALDWRDVLHGEDAGRVREKSAAGEASGAPFSLLARYRRADGEWRWLRSYSRPRVEGGKPAGFVGVAFDVTEAVAAEAALRESEARFRSMADGAPTPVWMTDAEGALEYGNAAFLDFSGRSLDEVRGHWWRDVLHPDDVEAVRAAREQARRDGQPYTVEQRLRHRDGAWRWYSVHGRPRFDAKGGFLGFVGISFEITSAKARQAALEQHKDGLEERVREALADKAHAEAALLQSQKLEAVGRLTGGVAHDFNNLLTVVIGSLDSILRRGDDPARRTRMAEAALQAARRGERLTQQLLAFARRQPLRPETVDVCALVRESEPLLRRALGEAITFVVRAPDAPLWARVDPAQFEAALMNLVVNAKDASSDGGRVSIEVWERRFEAGEVADGDAGDYVCVEVADTGSGMSSDVLARVFEPFFTTKPVGKGTGLGLAQVYGFARQSGGDADVYSAPGQGTRVALRMPRVGAAARPSVRPTPAAPTSVAGLSVLLVEDDPEVARLAETLLADQGCAVTTASSGEPALELLKGPAPFDVLLTDVVMPGGMNGVELAGHASLLRPELRIVLASGYVGEALDGPVGGAPWPLLRKPYTAEQLAAAVAVPGRAVEAA